jgi:hypothetical protein
MQDRIAQTKETMDEQSQQRLVTNFANYVSNALLVCPRLQNKKCVL